MTNLTRHDVLANFYDETSIKVISENGLKNSLQEYLEQNDLVDKFNTHVLLTFL